MLWIRNGALVEDTELTGSTLTAMRSHTIHGSAEYWRVEIRTEAGRLVAMTEPIFFKLVPPSLPPLVLIAQAAAIVLLVVLLVCIVRLRKAQTKPMRR